MGWHNKMVFKRSLLRILRDTDGATAVEYGLLVSLMILAIMVTVTGFATEVSIMWNNISTTLDNAIN